MKTGQHVAVAVALLLLLQQKTASAFSPHAASSRCVSAIYSPLFRRQQQQQREDFAPHQQQQQQHPYVKDQQSRLVHAASAVSSSSDAAGEASSSSSNLTPAQERKNERRARIRQEGGIFSISTKYGGLNLYGVYYGLVSILLGIPWYIAMTAIQFFYFLTGNRIDKDRFAITWVTHLWGTTLMTLTRNWPKVENKQILKDFYKEKRPAMFVANHLSWLDIPFMGGTIGWRNYKVIAKKELGKVPILGKAIRIGGHVMLDRTDRKSQLTTLKTGMKKLQDGCFLCTFPEGTRSRTGKLMPFKNGAFKMAHKVGAPVIPLSIVGANKVMPAHWMFPYRPGASLCKVVVHPPIESKGKTEEELAEAVRVAMISGLPPDQRPDGE